MAEAGRNGTTLGRCRHQMGPARTSYMLCTHLGELVPGTPTSSGEGGQGDIPMATGASGRSLEHKDGCVRPGV